MRLRSEQRKRLRGLQQRMNGAVEYRDFGVEVQPDSALRDSEEVQLRADAAGCVGEDAVNEAYFRREVAPQVTDAWIDAFKVGARDREVGVVGYAISFNGHSMSTNGCGVRGRLMWIWMC